MKLLFQALSIEGKWKNIKTIDGPVHLVDIKFELGFKLSDNTLVLSECS